MADERDAVRAKENQNLPPSASAPRCSASAVVRLLLIEFERPVGSGRVTLFQDSDSDSLLLPKCDDSNSSHDSLFGPLGATIDTIS